MQIDTVAKDNKEDEQVNTLQDLEQMIERKYAERTSSKDQPEQAPIKQTLAQKLNQHVDQEFSYKFTPSMSGIHFGRKESQKRMVSPDQIQHQEVGEFKSDVEMKEETDILKEFKNEEVGFLSINKARERAG